MSTIRQISIYINVDEAKLTNNMGGELPIEDKPHIYYGEKVIFCCNFRDASNNPYPLVAMDTFMLAVDSNFLHDDLLMVQSDNTMVNIPGDWVDVNFSLGKISVRINTHTDGYEAKIGEEASILGYLEIQKISYGNTSLMLQDQINCHNVINHGGGGPLPYEDYYTESDCDATFTMISKFNLDTPTSVSVATGAVVLPGSYMSIAPEAGSFDELDTITGGTAGVNCLMKLGNPVHSIILKHDDGNILCPMGRDLTITGEMVVFLNFDGAHWRVVSSMDDGLPIRKAVTEATGAVTVETYQCDGRPFSNLGATGPSSFALPVVADGLMFTGIVEEAEDFIITPQIGEIIVGVTVSGESISCNSIGRTIILKGTASGWYFLNGLVADWTVI